MTAALVLDGDFNLLDEQSTYRLVGLSTDEGTSWGNADTVDVELRSFMQYGTLVETENWSNRTLVLAIAIGGATMDTTAAQEARLMAKLHRRSTLAYTPETATVPTVFPVITSTLVPGNDDFTETFENEVIYTIRFTCTPFVRSLQLVTVAALTDAAGTTLIEDVTTGATGWTGTIPDAPGGTVSTAVDAAGVTVSSTARLTYASGGSYIPMILGKTFSSQNTTVQKYIVVDYRLGDGLDTGAPGNHLTMFDDALNDIYDSPVATMPSPDEPGMTRAYFQVKASTNAVTQLRWQYTLYQAVPTSAPGLRPVPSLKIGRVIRTAVAPTLAGRQSVRSLDVKGVMPTTGSIAVSHAGALQETIIYTWERQGNDGYVPACRGYLNTGASGAVTANTSAVSGSRTNMSTNSYYQIPADKLPEGDYLIAMRVDFSGKANADQVISLGVGAYMGGSPIQPDEYLGLFDVSDQYDDARGGYQTVLVTTISFPRVKMARTPNGYTKVYFNFNQGAGTAFLDELLLFNLTIGQRHHFYDLPPRLWIDSPDVGNNGQPEVWCGTASDRSDAVSAFPLAKALDIHQFDPTKGISVYCMASGPSVPATVEFSYYPQFWYRVPVVT